MAERVIRNLDSRTVSGERCTRSVRWYWNLSGKYATFMSHDANEEGYRGKG